MNINFSHRYGKAWLLLKLSMNILADWLEQYQPIIKIENGMQELRNVRMLTDDTKVVNQNVYLASVNDYYSKDEGVICANEKDIIFLKDSNINQVFNDILTAFDFYNDWSDGLIEKINEGCSLQTIVDNSVDLFKNPIVVLDTSHVAMANTKGYGIEKIEQDWSHELMDNSIPLEKVNRLIPLLASKKNCTEPFPMDNSLFSYSSVIRNLFVYGKKKGSTVVIEVNQKNSYGRVQLFNELANIIEYWLKINEDQNEFKDESAIFVDILEGKTILASQIEHKLGLLSWDKEDDKILIKAKFSSKFEEMSYSLHKYLENILFNCSIFNYRGTVIIIINLKLNKLDTILRQITSYLKKTSAYAGMSYVFEDVQFLRQHEKQADIALQYGDKKIGKIYDCKDYALRYGLSMINVTITTDICHPGLHKLLEYDKKHNSDFYETLRLYLLNERSQLITANEFGIHRNSLVYRIQKIEEIIEEDLNDRNIRLYLLFSFLLKES